MILHRLCVTHWRSLIAPTDVGPFAPGLNVIHAPNGTGKSSLFEALRRTLFDTHTVTGQDIEAVRPWGRSLTPRVLVEFSQNQIRYCVEKTFLDGAGARLSRFEEGRFVALADGRNADSKLREVLEANEVPGRGLSKQEHWGLGQILWAPQGGLKLTHLTASVVENIRQALGAQVIGSDGNRLEERLEELYLQTFTKAGKPRQGKDAAPCLKLQADLDAALLERQRCRQEQQQFEEAARAVEDARQRRAQARREADGIQQSLTTERRNAESFQALRRLLEQARQAEQTAKERADLIATTLDRIQHAREETQGFAATVKLESPRLDLYAQERKDTLQRAEERRRDRDAARQQRVALLSSAQLVDEARAFLTETQSHQSLSERYQKVQALQAELAQEHSARAALLAPDDKTLAEIRKQLATRDKAKTTLEASLIRLTIEPNARITVRPSSSAAPQPLPADQPATFTGTPQVSLQIEGFGRIQASGPEVDAVNLQARVLDAEMKLAKLTQDFGSDDPDRLQAARTQAHLLDTRIQTLATKRDELLQGQTLEQWRNQLSHWSTRVQQRLERFPQWRVAPPVVSDLQAALDQQRKSVETQIVQAEDACDRADRAQQTAERRWTETEAAVKHARSNLAAAEARLADLTRDGLPDTARQTARDDALAAWRAARLEAEYAAKNLAVIGDDPQQAVATLERQLKAQELAEATARDDENKAEGRLSALAAAGAYSQLVTAEEEVTDLTAQLDRAMIQMDALRLLHDTVAECKAATVAAVVAPVAAAASRMLSRTAGPRLGPIRLDDQFIPHSIEPEPGAGAVTLENLSGGEQEQLFLVTRLALGQVLAKTDRQLVVLDDVLNATDTGRLARLLRLLDEASDRLQIVILTCHPERYRALDRTEFFDLDRIVQEASKP